MNGTNNYPIKISTVSNCAFALLAINHLSAKKRSLRFQGLIIAANGL